MAVESYSRANHVCAFARSAANEAIVVAVPRLCATLLAEKRDSPMGPEVWGDTTIELPRHLNDREYHNVFTGESFRPSLGDAVGHLSMGELLSNFPCVLLYSGG